MLKDNCLRLISICLFSGSRSEDLGRHACSTGMLGQSEVVQHSGIGLESLDSSAGVGSAGLARGSSGKLRGNV